MIRNTWAPRKQINQIRTESAEPIL